MLQLIDTIPSFEGEAEALASFRRREGLNFAATIMPVV